MKFNSGRNFQAHWQLVPILLNFWSKKKILDKFEKVSWLLFEITTISSSQLLILTENSLKNTSMSSIKSTLTTVQQQSSPGKIQRKWNTLLSFNAESNVEKFIWESRSFSKIIKSSWMKSTRFKDSILLKLERNYIS